MTGNTETKPNAYQEKPGGLFKKGNPGKPKGARHMTTLLREYIEKEIKGLTDEDGKPIKYDQQITKTVLTKALEGEPWAVKLAYEYLDGKPHQSTDITSGGEKIPTTINIIKPSE